MKLSYDHVIVNQQSRNHELKQLNAFAKLVNNAPKVLLSMGSF